MRHENQRRSIFTGQHKAILLAKAIHNKGIHSRATPHSMVATVSTVLPEFDLRPMLDELILASCLSRAQDGGSVEYESTR